MILACPAEPETTRISTIEHAHHWLKRNCPDTDHTRDLALSQVEAAMDCLVSVTSARHAFLAAADAAGYASTQVGRSL